MLNKLDSYNINYQFINRDSSTDEDISRIINIIKTLESENLSNFK